MLLQTDNNFFDWNFSTIIKEFALTGTSRTYNDYTVTYLPAKEYDATHFPPKTELIKEFERDINSPQELKLEYIQSLKLDDNSRYSLHDKYWNHPENMERAREIQKTYQKPEIDETIINTLYKKYDDSLEVIHAADLQRTQEMEVSVSFEQAISHVEKTLEVRFAKAWFLGSLWLHLYNFWHGLGLTRLYVYNDDTTRSDPNYKNKYLGSVIIHHTKGQAFTTPLLTTERIQYVATTEDSNTIHELTHAVHFSFVPYYQIPRDLVEIPSMCAENSYREVPLSHRFLNRQIALSIADLTADTPDEFNYIYEKYAKVTNAGHVRARMWHFVNMPYKYYSYAIGMTANNYPALKQAVRSYSREVIMECVSVQNE